MMTRIVVKAMVVGPDLPQQHDAAITLQEDDDSSGNDGDDYCDADDADNDNTHDGDPRRIEP